MVLSRKTTLLCALLLLCVSLAVHTPVQAFGFGFGGHEAHDHDHDHHHDHEHEDLYDGKRSSLSLFLTALGHPLRRAALGARWILSHRLAHSDVTVLGLSMDASEAQIKKAYRKLSLKYHPGTT